MNENACAKKQTQHLISEIKKNDADAQFRFFGGDLMQNIGGNLTRHYRELAFMGVFEVLLTGDA